VLSLSGNFDLHALRGALSKKQGAFALRALMNRWRDGQAVLRQFDESLIYVVHAKAKVMQSGAVFSKPRLERVIEREWLDKLQMRVTQVEVCEPDGTLVNHFTVEHS
jgi:hypothetical protein